MTTFDCPHCWSEVLESATICPHCYDDTSERVSESDYTHKLISALRHKEPITFLVESAVEALGKIGGTAATEAVRAATQHSSLRMRVRACRVLQQVESDKLS